jgi:hypothetical protein
MATPAELPDPPARRFRKNLKEVEDLLQMHAAITGGGPGRPRDVEVLNKSAILFTCAAFEAFIEDLATATFNHIVSDSEDPASLPLPLRKHVAEVIKTDKNELKVWELAGDGWRQVTEAYKTTVVRNHTSGNAFNTPNPHNIEELFRRLVGYSDLPKQWSWKGMSSARAAEKLKGFVKLRGALAHGEQPAPSVTKAAVLGYLGFMAPLACRSSNIMREYCQTTTGRYPWRRIVYGKIA